MTPLDSPPPHVPRRPMLRPRVIVPATLAFVLIAGLALLFVPAMLIQHWYPGGRELDEATMRAALGQAAQVVLFALGGIIAVVGVAVSLSRHREELEAAERDRARQRLETARNEADNERELRSRFVSAVDFLSDRDRFMTRIAGMYAIAGLADDWGKSGRDDERQVCIDVLCAYLRSPVRGTDVDEYRVRSAGYRMIREHLRPTPAGEVRWQGAAFDLTALAIDFPVDLSGMLISDATRLDLGHLQMDSVRLDLKGLRLEGATLNLRGAKLSSSSVDLRGAQILNGIIDLRDAHLETGSVFELQGAQVRRSSLRANRSSFDESTLRLKDINIRGGAVNWGGSTFERSTIDASGAKISGGRLNLSYSTVLDGNVDMNSLDLRGGLINLEGVTIRSGDLSLTRSLLKGGTLNLQRASVETVVVEDARHSRCDVQTTGVSIGQFVDQGRVVVESPTWLLHA